MKKICLVGCGTIGRVHAANLSPLAEMFFCSRSRSSAAAFQEEFQGQGIFEEFAEALRAPEIEAVVIASPPEFHAGQIVQALEADKSVLVEKPMCVAPEEFDPIEQALEARPDLFLMVAENYYYKPSLTPIKELIARGWIGRVESAFVQKRFVQAAAGWKSRYGALLEGGVHFVALISALFDAAPQRVEAEFPHRQSGQEERHSRLRMDYESGAVAALEYSWNTPSLTRGTFQHSHIRGDQGRIVFESNGIYVWLNAKRKKRLYFPGLGDLMGYRRMSQDFIDCLNDSSRQPESDFHRARRDLQIIFAAYQGL